MPTSLTPARERTLRSLMLDRDAEQRVEDALVARLNAISPIRRAGFPWIIDPAGVAAGDKLGYPYGPPGTRPAWTWASPSTPPTPFWMPADGTIPTPPAEPSLVEQTFKAHEMVVTTTLSGEDAADLRLALSAPQPSDAERVGLAVLEPLAVALAREESRAILAGAGTNLDPVAGLASLGTIATRPVGTDTVTDAIVKAAGDLRRAGRTPTVVLVGASLYEALRIAKDTAGRYLFDPAKPVTIADLPVIDCGPAIPASTSTYCFVADGSGIVIFQRLMDGGRRLEFRISDHAKFETHQVVLRVRQRVGLGGIAAFSASGIIKITGVNAP